MDKKEFKKIITPEGVVSYPSVFERSEYSGKYEITLVFPAKTDLSELKKEAMRAAKAKWGEKVKTLSLRSPFRKCGEKPESYKGFEPDDIFITFRSKCNKIGIIKTNGEEIVDPSDLYAGCYARVSTQAYHYSKKGNKGVAFGLNNILKVDDGNPIGFENPPADEDFDDWLDAQQNIDSGKVEDDIFGNSTSDFEDDEDFTGF